MTRITLVLRHGPESDLAVREMVDLVMVLATFECPVTVVIVDAGVLWTRLPTFPEGHPRSVSGKLKSLPLYDVDTILVSQQALNAYSVYPASAFPGSVVDASAIRAAVSEADAVFEA
jgi:sulfur relay (sulfurtransferase) DsrF/TusC family protein